MPGEGGSLGTCSSGEIVTKAQAVREGLWEVGPRDREDADKLRETLGLR